MNRVPSDADVVRHVTIMPGDESDDESVASPPALAPVEPWSSTHLSDDDSDEEEASSSSSPSTEDNEAADAVQSFSNGGDESENDDWLLDVDVDLPTEAEGPPSAPPPPPPVASKLVDSRRLVSPTETDSMASPPPSPSPVRPAESIHRPTSPPSPQRQIPRPTLTRQLSLNASPPKLLASLERSPSKLLLPPKSPASSPSKKRGMSISVVPDKQPVLLPSSSSFSSASSQFWATEQSRRSSRLLDEWKRKEIWHDLKRAEETVLTTTAPEPAPSLDRKSSASSLNSVLLGERTTASQPPPPPQTLRHTGSFMSPKVASEPHDHQEEPSAPATEHARVAAALAAEQQQSRSLHERLLSLENAERENRFLKEEIQSHLMQALSTKELVKTLEDQLSLTARSEEQLKLQTKQLLQQNQSLQAELLDKIAAETAKIQKMAHLAADKQALLDDLQRREQQAATRLARVRGAVLRRLLAARRLHELRASFADWRAATSRHAATLVKALATLDAAARRAQLKDKARAFSLLKQQALLASHAQSQRHVAALAVRTLLRARRRSELQCAVHQWRAVLVNETLQRQRVAAGVATLAGAVRARVRSRVDQAFATWRVAAAAATLQLASDRGASAEHALAEAKDCVFALSRAKRKLEDAGDAQREELEAAGARLQEHAQELRLVKHAYVATVVRASERQWLRGVVAAWRAQSREQVLAKAHALSLEQAVTAAEAKAQYAQSLDDYNKVLRSDLERAQFLSLDKKVAVDVLAKKLLREEQRRAQLEEQHVLLDHKLQTCRAQLATLLGGGGEEEEGGNQGGGGGGGTNTLPLVVVQLGRDAVDASLRELSAWLQQGGGAPHERLATYIKGTKAVEDASVDVDALVAKHAPPGGGALGVRELVAWLTSVARDVYGGAAASTKQLWSRLLAAPRRIGGDGGAGVKGGAGGAAGLMNGATPSTTAAVGGRLSEEILQNQEKLLAVLEHETAVVERAVMEKASLKHTYATKEFHEYQCEPVADSDCQFLAPGISHFAHWAQTGQVTDLVLAFLRPLHAVVRKYSNERQLAMPLSGVTRLLEDLRLYPSYVTSALVHHHFGRLCDRDGLLAPPTVAVFLGCCALELFAASPANSAAGVRLSAREIVLSFFCDLGFLPDSDIPPPPFIALVGAEVETILWPLFEYYASSADDGSSPSGGATATDASSRRGMTRASFAKFAADIVGVSAPVADRLFQRVVQDTRRGGSAELAVIHLDEFYIAIALLQEERSGARVTNFGEAVRHWMQQTQ